MNITMNCGNPFVTKIRGRENRYNVVCGMFAHELGHILYTDFLASQTHLNYIAAYKWYPYPPDMKTTAEIRNEKSLWNYAKASQENLNWVQYIASYIANILEDGYIENRMLNDFPGTLGYGLSETRRVHYESMSTVTQLIEREDSGEIHIFETIMQLMLSYAKFGEIKYGDEPLSDERIRTVFALISDIDSALLNRSGKIYNSYLTNRGARDVIAFLAPYGITANRAVEGTFEYTDGQDTETVPFSADIEYSLSWEVSKEDINDKYGTALLICEHEWSAKDGVAAGIAGRAGIGWNREEVRWSRTELVPGVYKIPDNMRRELEYAKEAGMKIELGLLYSNPDCYDSFADMMDPPTTDEELEA